MKQELKKHPATIDFLVEKLQQGFVHIPQILDLDITQFIRVPYTAIKRMNEARDPQEFTYVLEALEEYHILKDLEFFNFFDNLEVLQFADRHTYRFSATCLDIDKIMHWYHTIDTLFPCKQKGLCKQSFPFTKENLIDFVIGNTNTAFDAVREYWNFDKFSIMLDYAHDTDNELQLSFYTFEPVIDYSKRQKGTVLDLLPFEIPGLFNEKSKPNLQSFIIHQSPSNASAKTYIEFTLEKRLFDSFDRINVVQYSEKPDISCEVPYDVQIYAEEIHNCFEGWKFVDQLIHLYGSDSEGNGRLLIEDPSDIIEHKLLVYRHWQFNQHHALYNENNPKEKLVYEVILEKESGYFQLSILRYDLLLKHFGKGFPH